MTNTKNSFKLLSVLLSALMVLAIFVTWPIKVSAAAPASYSNISADSTASVSITSSGGAKYFRFVPTYSGTYKFYSSNYSGDPKCSLLDASGSELVTYDDNGDYNFNFTYDCTANTVYYVKAYMYGSNTGSYTLNVQTVSIVNNNNAEPTVNVDTPYQSYPIFNSGRPANSDGYKYSSSYNYDAASFSNGGYDLYSSYSTAAIKNIRLGLSFTMEANATENAQVTIYAFDVDEESGERDCVRLVDETTGTRTVLTNTSGKDYLSGQDWRWSTTSFVIPASLLIEGHTYHFENEETVSGWVVYIRTVDLQINGLDTEPVPQPEKELTVDDFYGSISSNGTVSTTLEAHASSENTYELEYKATYLENGAQKGLSTATITVPTTTTSFSNSFNLESGSPRGTYEITVYIRRNGTIIDTAEFTASYGYSAVSYNTNGGSNIKPTDTNTYSSGDTVTVMFNQVPSLYGYVFLGWSTDRYATVPTYTADGVNTFTIGSSDVTLYAIWAPDICEHTSSHWETDFEATCTTPGSKYCVCDACGETIDTAYIPAPGHRYTSEVAQEPTCTTPGIIVYTCENCGDSYTGYIYAEHHFSVTEYVPATCTEDGYYRYDCDNCEEYYIEVIPGSHDYIATITKVATEYEEGEITYTCSICGDSYTEAIPTRPDATILLVQDRLPWTEGINTAILDRLMAAGYISGWDMTTTASLDASLLASYDVVFIANDQTTATYDQLARFNEIITQFATAGGVVIYGACDHGWAGGSLTHALPGNVTKGNYYSYRNYIVNGTHNVVTGVLTDGKSLTNELLYSTYSSHTYFTNLPENAISILEDAYGRPTLVEYPLGNGYIIASGLTWEYTYVRNFVNGTSFAKSVYDDLIVHAVMLSDPCSHTFDEGTVVDPTCTEQGYTLHTCTQCGATIKDNYTDALGHQPGEWETIEEPTEYTAGLKVIKCTRCGEIIQREVLPPIDSPVVSIESDYDTVILGQTIEFYVNINDCDPIKALAIQPIFDTDVFELVSAEWLTPATLQYIEAGTNRAVSAWSSSTTVSGRVYKIVLRAKQLTSATEVTAEVLIQTPEKSELPVVGKTVAVITCPHASYSFNSLNDTYHTKVCDICGHIEVLAHTFDNGCDTMCNDCGHTREPSHTPAANWSYDDNNHWHECEVCGESLDLHEHVFDHGCDTDCNVCGYTRVTTHVPAVDWSHDDNYHWYDCVVCGADFEIDVHTYDHSCDTDCNVCGHTRVISHTPNADWSYNGSEHWHDCLVCGERLDLSDHTYDGDTDRICNDCGYCRTLRGDLVVNNQVDSDDAIYLLMHTFFSDDDAYKLNQCGDFDGDGDVDSDDSIYLLMYSYFPQYYPLHDCD